MSISSPSHQPLTECPGCGSTALGECLALAQQPVILNYRFDSREAAESVERRDIHLRECNDCGLIFNSILDEHAIPYDEAYENRQNFSVSFQRMLEETADRLATRYSIQEGMIAEVGCGKGDFLTLICERTASRGIGFDTSCEETEPALNGSVKFFKKYMTASDVHETINLVVCRHVVEHVPKIGDFFKLLYSVSIAGGGSTVYVETPSFEWIARNDAFWDIFYEHCNYFPTHTLRQLAEMAGFTVLDHSLIFGDQYQSLELRPLDPSKSASKLYPEKGPMLLSFAGRLKESKINLEARLAHAGWQDGWAIWGAGAKGVCLANAALKIPPTLVVDSNPSKQGMFLPGTGVPVVSPSDPRLSAIGLILVANPNYLAEIKTFLDKNNLFPILIPL